jgi:hypothetical protein
MEPEQTDRAPDHTVSARGQQKGMDESLTCGEEAVDETCLDGDDSNGGGGVEEMKMLGEEPR